MSQIEELAYTATMKASSADVSMTATFSTGNHKLYDTSTESGPVSWAADEAQFKTTLTLNGKELVTMRQIIEGNHTYSRVLSPVHLPSSLTSGIPGLSGWEETTWSGTPSQDPAQGLSVLLFAGTDPGNALNPASMLALLEAEASSVKDLGSAVLDGVSTTHYRALVPLSHLGPMTSAELKQAEQYLGRKSLSFDYWIDFDGLLRQLRFGISVNPPRQQKDAPGELTQPISYPISTSITLRLSNYGTPVNIVPPSSSQITSQGSCVVSASSLDCND